MDTYLSEGDSTAIRQPGLSTDRTITFKFLPVCDRIAINSGLARDNGKAMEPYQVGCGRLYVAGKWIDEIEYEVIPQKDKDLDGFVWSRDARLPVSPVPLVLTLDGASLALVELVQLRYQRRKGKYQYGLRILRSDALPPLDMPEARAPAP